MTKISDELLKKWKKDSKTNKSAAVRTALIESGYPDSNVGKKDVEHLMKKHGLTDTQLSVYVSAAKKSIDKAAGKKSGPKKVMKKKPTTKNTSSAQVEKLCVELIGEKVEGMLNLLDGNEAAAKLALQAWLKN
ncbi:hypothetical protein Pla110_32870 [Polystyrenella longa]|uniref:Uncharacterized protein n=1 Tax=Polystyrenella longa TaxID=2528007 RepID=A0A518CQQ9_9PLAN|nr:hypothetical protein [Polystyrenella longa]QDU81545.1 hypothetical protein Pla110_32870 [Polystyrenella longa]